ncbi:hypothetical protein AVEN_144340-1, partial [Araneus ventricosus]
MHAVTMVAADFEDKYVALVQAAKCRDGNS